MSPRLCTKGTLWCWGKQPSSWKSRICVNTAAKGAAKIAWPFLWD